MFKSGWKGLTGNINGNLIGSKLSDLKILFLLYFQISNNFKVHSIDRIRAKFCSNNLQFLLAKFSLTGLDPDNATSELGFVAIEVTRDGNHTVTLCYI